LEIAERREPVNEMRHVFPLTQNGIYVDIWMDVDVDVDMDDFARAVRPSGRCVINMRLIKKTINKCSVSA